MTNTGLDWRIVGAVMEDARFVDAAKVTFVVLAVLLDETAGGGVTVEMIAKRRGMSDRSVYRHLAELEQCGYLMRIAQFYDDGAQGHNAYRLAGKELN